MFTGLIEQVCTVKSAQTSAGAVKLTIDLGKLADECKIGDSVAISGVCLTVAGLEGGLVRFDVSAETLKTSNLTKLTAGSKVNVELAMKIGDRFGGHIVQGHVDGVAKIKTVDKRGKGSVAIDGISLTIASMDGSSFGVALIPETLKQTTLGEAKTGDVVNIETDIITKTIKKQLEKILPQKQTLTEEKLKQLGF
jgi:riboflavin synthase